MSRRVWTIVAAALAMAACGRAPQGQAATASAADTAARDGNGEAPRLLSAFFGLDNALPVTATRLCVGAPGKDGMPVVLSHTIDASTLDREDFVVTTRSGLQSTPFCVTLAPAMDPGELRTVLLVGEFGGGDDPPATVRVVGDIISDGTTGGPVNFKGTEVAVTPLAAGPTLVLAERVPPDEWPAGRGGCPAGTNQVVRVTWAGGVKPPNGGEAGDVERARYRVTVARAGGSRAEVAPDGLADLDDRDNNHLLCLSTADPATMVSFPAGLLVDPNGDLNPATDVTVTAPGRVRRPSGLGRRP